MPKASPLSLSILREYDIRGTVGKNLEALDAQAIGQRFATVLKKLKGNNSHIKVVVCRDGRHSSMMLQASLIFGLRQAGVHVTDIGVGPTPMLYFAVKKYGFCAGVMVTGSHNPPKDNGFKFTLLERPFFGQDIADLAEVVPAFSDDFGSYETLDVQESYVQRLLKGYTKPTKNRLKIAIDPGNGATGRVANDLAHQLDADVQLINDKIDGSFPAHHPDPSVEGNMLHLIKLVKDKGLDLGIAFDGDGDRIGVVDHAGNMLWGDQLLMILCDDVLKHNKGGLIIADVKSSNAVKTWVQSLGGEFLLWKTGHSHIKAKIAETNALLAGEMSGHIFFNHEYLGFDDGLYAAVRLIRYLQDNALTLKELVDKLPVMHSTPELRIPCKEEEKKPVLDFISQHLQSKDCLTIDGIRFTTEQGWFLVRASQTQSYLVARVEAKTPEDLKILSGQLKKLLSAAGVEQAYLKEL